MRGSLLEINDLRKPCDESNCCLLAIFWQILRGYWLLGVVASGAEVMFVVSISIFRIVTLTNTNR